MSSDRDIRVVVLDTSSPHVSPVSAYETGRGIVRVSPPPSAWVHPSTVNHQKGRVGVCVEEDAYIFIGRVGELCGAAKAM